MCSIRYMSILIILLGENTNLYNENISEFPHEIQQSFIESLKRLEFEIFYLKIEKYG